MTPWNDWRERREDRGKSDTMERLEGEEGGVTPWNDWRERREDRDKSDTMERLEGEEGEEGGQG